MHRTTPASAGGSHDEPASAQPPETPKKPAKPSLLINRNFALLWSGQTISVIGDFAFSTTLAVWVFILANGQTWAPLAVTGVYIATALPMLLIGPLAGVFVDRWNKRRTMLAVNVISATLVAALLPVTGVVSLAFLTQLPVVGEALSDQLVSGQIPLSWRLGSIYVVVFLVNSAGRFFLPSQTALIGDLVSDAYRGRAMGLNQASLSIAILLGAIIAPPLVVNFGAQWALTFDALTFVVSYGAIRAIHPPTAARSVAPDERGHVGREFAAGVRFFARSRVLRTIFVGGFIVMLGAGVLNALDIFFVTGNLHTPVALYGVLSAATGAGMIGGSIFAAMFSHKLGYARSVWMSLLGVGAMTLVYSRLTSFGPALAVMVVVGILQALLNVAVGPLLLGVTPRTLIGRTNALLDLALTTAGLVGSAAAGYLAGTVLAGFSLASLGLTFGPIDTIFSASGLLVLVGGIYCALTLRTKTVEREWVAAPDEPDSSKTPDTPGAASRPSDPAECAGQSMADVRRSVAAAR